MNKQEESNKASTLELATFDAEMTDLNAGMNAVALYQLRVRFGLLENDEEDDDE